MHIHTQTNTHLLAYMVMYMLHALVVATLMVCLATFFRLCFATQRDEDLIQIERRNFFSLLCLDLEAQLIHANLALIPEMLCDLVKVECIGHEEVGKRMTLTSCFATLCVYFSYPDADVTQYHLWVTNGSS